MRCFIEALYTVLDRLPQEMNEVRQERTSDVSVLLIFVIVLSLGRNHRLTGSCEHSRVCELI